MSSPAIEINPEKIEAALKSHEAVKECAVITIDKDTGGVEILAFLKVDAQSNIGVKIIRRFLAEKLRAEELPESYQFVIDYPHTDDGKIDRHKLKQTYLAEKKLVRKTEERLEMPYKWAYGTALTRYFNELKENEQFVGLKCPSCSKVYVPPKRFCGRCFVENKEWVNVKDTGVLITYTTVYMSFEGQLTEPPYICGNVHLDGSDTAILYLIKAEDEEKLKVGMPMKTVWKNKSERKGSLLDIAWFEPA